MSPPLRRAPSQTVFPRWDRPFVASAPKNRIGPPKIETAPEKIEATTKLETCIFFEYFPFSGNSKSGYPLHLEMLACCRLKRSARMGTPSAMLPLCWGGPTACRCVCVYSLFFSFAWLDPPLHHNLMPASVSRVQPWPNLLNNTPS